MYLTHGQCDARPMVTLSHQQIGWKGHLPNDVFVLSAIIAIILRVLQSLYIPAM